MANSVIQSGWFGNSSTTSQSIAFSAIAAGNTLIIAVNIAAATASALPAGTQVDLTQTSTFGDTWKIYSIPSIVDARTTFTFTTSVAVGIQGYFFEVSGLATSSYLDTTFADASTGAICASSGTVTTANSFIISILTEQNGGANTVLAGPPTQVLITGEASFNYASYALDGGATGAKTVGATMTNTPSCKAFGAAYKTATGGGGGGTSRVVRLLGVC